MANYRYLGYGITDNNGIAHLDHDANGNPIQHSYTGTGAGELDIIASLDDSSKISEGSLVSEIYEVLDTLFYDEATSSKYNDNWKLGGSPTILRDEIGTTLSTPDSTWRNISVSSNKTDYMYFSNPVCFEFDVLSISDTCRLEIFYSNSLRVLVTFKNYGIGHYRIEYTPTSQKLYVDDVLKQSNTFDFTLNNPRLTLTVWDGGEFKFKNFKVYPI